MKFSMILGVWHTREITRQMYYLSLGQKIINLDKSCEFLNDFWYLVYKRSKRYIKIIAVGFAETPNSYSQASV